MIKLGYDHAYAKTAGMCNMKNVLSQQEHMIWYLADI